MTWEEALFETFATEISLFERESLDAAKTASLCQLAGQY